MKNIQYMICVVFLNTAINAMGQYAIPPKMKWWYNARFGMFIHFGSYSYLGHGEWAFSTDNWTKANYQTQVSAKFNPDKFNGGTIARLAKKAGMKYLVITAKHHEGFCMWDTQVESFKDVTGTKQYDLPDFTGFKRDLLRELKDSCEVHGIQFCLYYSILDWNHPSQEINRTTYYSNMASDSARTAYIRDMKAQLVELINQYRPKVLWFDGDWTFNGGTPTLSSWWTKSDGLDLYQYLIGLDSTLIVNERVCRGFGLGDFECPEQEVPATPRSRPWETCRTMNNAWGYTIWDNNWKSATTLIKELATVASRDGNYLLNIGLKGDGTVPEASIALLNQIGDWMEMYGESIYGTTRNPYPNEPWWGVYTKREGKLFVHVFEWPRDGVLKISSLANPIWKIYSMRDSTTTFHFTDSLGCITIFVPKQAPNPHNSVLTVEVSGIPSPSRQYVKINRILIKSATGRYTITTPKGTLQMIATVSPSNATIKSVMWSVSDTTVAGIDANGLLTAKKNGTVLVMATANDGTGIQGKRQIQISGQTPVENRSTLFPPETLVLEQNYPNPLNNRTMFKFTLPQKSFVTLEILDVLGRPVATLVSQEFTSGTYVQEWDAKDLPSGIYFLSTSNRKL